MINYVDGDLIKLAKQGRFDVIVHGCNCFCQMGAGIAPQMAEVRHDGHQRRQGGGDWRRLWLRDAKGQHRR